MAKLASLGVLAAAAFATTIGSTNAADRLLMESLDQSTQTLLATMTPESKCQILVDAMRTDNEAVIRWGFVLIEMSVMSGSNIFRNEFGQTEVKELYRRSFSGCAKHPGDTISSQAHASFQSIAEEIHKPGYRDGPELDDVSIPVNVQTAAEKLRSILPDAPVISEAKITMKTKDGSKLGGETTFTIKPHKGGTTRVQEDYTNFTMDRELMGLIQLKSRNNARGYTAPSGDQRITTTTALMMDASAWTAGASFSFETATSVPIGTWKTTCKIGQEVDASSIHPSLMGRAWPLECESSGLKNQGFYIEELRYYLKMHSESKYGIADDHIERLDITR
ncbi:hypothetical protein [Rhizobium lusitanum]|uniref:DUF1849 family protein n=1 Tax=Rhizobium lusitanum TaxID=293958 RepID=A0A7X0ITW4_9HYPH|nr:hypothetical protein [Rhizobium lusitanum]MBB6487106.1 hypothetical protein [Rhizobium lusitanum]